MAEALTATPLPAGTEDQISALIALWQAEGRVIEMTLHGGSMMPTILPGTRFRLHCRTGIPEIGSIVACRQGRTLVVHRLIEVMGVMGAPEAPQVVCLGDGNIVADPPVPADAVMGVVCAVSSQPLAKRILFALRHPRRHGRYLLRRLFPNPGDT